MMIASAIGCEYFFHKRFCRNAAALTGINPHVKKHDTAKRYAIALSIGLCSWEIHQQLFHHHDEHKSVIHAKMSQDFRPLQPIKSLNARYTIYTL